MFRRNNEVLQVCLQIPSELDGGGGGTMGKPHINAGKGGGGSFLPTPPVLRFDEAEKKVQ